MRMPPWVYGTSPLVLAAAIVIRLFSSLDSIAFLLSYCA
jgi:hypothetical protein